MSPRLRSAVRELEETLASLDDPRAAAVLRALPTGRRWDLDVLEAALDATDREGEALRALAELRGPDLAQTRIVTDALLAAALEVEDTRHATELDERAADIVRAALAWHEIHGAQPCPLCGTGQLGPGWRGWAELWLAERQLSNARGAIAQAALARAEDQARELTRPLEIPTGAGIDTSAVATAIAHLAAAALLQGKVLAREIDERAEDLSVAIATVAAEARARLAQRQERWAPIACRIAAVLAEARAAGRLEPPVTPPGAPRPARRVRRSPRRANLESGA